MSTSSDLPASVTIRPATLSDLVDVLYLRQAQELAESGTTATTLDQLRAAWETLGPRLPEQVWVATTTDSKLVASVELVRSDPMLPVRLWILPDRRGIGLEGALLTTVEQQACDAPCRGSAPFHPLCAGHRLQPSAPAGAAAGRICDVLDLREDGVGACGAAGGAPSHCRHRYSPICCRARLRRHLSCR